ncbi:hypothetical protein MMC11_002189 [Xylographa trunciseda]|nr:hypothetical protein [Xylographa trunciseda]
MSTPSTPLFDDSVRLIGPEEPAIVSSVHERPQKQEADSRTSADNFAIAFNQADKQEVRTRLHRLRGAWRTTVSWGMLGVLLVFIVNVSALAWMYARFPGSGDIVTVYGGTCSRTRTLSTVCHLTINILSTIMLGASNFGMQCLSSPSRIAIDAAHRNGYCLNIGVPNIASLRVSQALKLALWLLLAVSSVSLHLLYNSVLYTTSSGSDFTALLVAENFLTGGPWNSSRLEASQFPVKSIDVLQSQISGLTTLQVSDCIQACNTTLGSDWGNVLLVTNSTLENDTLYDVFISSYVEDSLEVGLCGLESAVDLSLLSSGDGDDLFSLQLSCDTANLSAISVQSPYSTCSNNSTQPHTIKCPEIMRIDVPIQYCLIQPRSGCKLIAIPSILITVVVCNIVKFMCLLSLLLLPEFNPFITVGDAVASFLKDPDQWTDHYGPVSAQYVHHCMKTKAIEISGLVAFNHRPQRWKIHTCSWFRGASRRRWISTGVATMIYWVLALSLFFAGLGASRTSFSINGLGATTSTFISGASTASKVIITNTPQVLFSLIYLLYNSLFTSMLATAEVNSLAHRRKPLRVSDPHGAQRATYYLQLPYRYGIPLMIVSGLLHWLISETIFLVNVSVFDVNDVEQPSRSTSACGWSATGLYIFIVIGTIMVATPLGFGSRKYHSGMPIVSTCSRAISAACHAAPGDDNAASKALMYGVIHQTEDGRELVGFSSKEVKPLEAGKVYGGEAASDRGEVTSNEGTSSPAAVDELGTPWEPPNPTAFGNFYAPGLARGNYYYQ